MKKLFFFSLFLLLTFLSSYGQKKILSLWKSVPNQLQTNEKEVITKDRITKIFNVQDPSLEVFLPEKQSSNNKAVLIFPGGGYSNLAYDHEGVNFAKWLNYKGITAFVLKYRLPNSKSIIKKHLAPLQDAQRAIRLIRFNAEKWNIKKNKIGILGFSAGGHLASTLGTHSEYESYKKQDTIDTISAKPNFMALVYPVISMKDSITHQGSKLNLLGKYPSKNMVKFYSNELQVNELTPSTFIVHSTDDNVVPVENSMLFYQALKRNNIMAEIHIFPHGGHGFAFARDKGQLENWPELLYNWLNSFD